MTSVSDDFNRSNENLEADSNWSADGTGSLRITSNEVDARTAYIADKTNWTGDTFDDDQTASVIVRDMLSGDVWFGPVVRGGAAADGGYSAEIRPNGDCEVYLNSSTLVVDISAGISADDRVEIDANGTTITVSVNGSSQGSGTNASLSGGEPGLMAFVNPGDTGTAIFDDFQADDEAGGATTHEGAGTLDVEPDNSSVADAEFESSASLDVEPDNSSTTTAVFESSALLDVEAAISAVSDLIAEVSNSLGFGPDVTSVANIQTDQSGSFSATAGITSEAGLEIGVSGSLDHSENISGVSEITIEASGPLDVTTSLASTVIATFEPSASINAVTGVIAVAVAELYDTGTIGAAVSLSGSGGLLIDESASLEATASFTGDGDISVTVQVTAYKTYTDRYETRNRNFIDSESTTRSYTAILKPKNFRAH